MKPNRLNTVEALINSSKPETRSVIYQLNGRYDTYYIGRHKTYLRDPVLRRTESGRHYRLAPILAHLLGINIAEPAGAHETVPPTVLATPVETITRLEEYVQEQTLTPREIANGIRRALGMPTEPKA